MDRNILAQRPAQEAIGQRRKQTLVMIEKAGGAFGYGKAPDQVVLGEIFACKTWVAENNLSQRRKPEEEAKNFTMRFDVGETTPQYTAQQDRRPGILLLRRSRQSCRKLAVRGRVRVSFTAAQLTVTLILLPTSEASVRRQALPMRLSRLWPPCRNAASKAEQDKFNIVEAE